MYQIGDVSICYGGVVGMFKIDDQGIYAKGHVMKLNEIKNLERVSKSDIEKQILRYETLLKITRKSGGFQQPVSIVLVGNQYKLGLRDILNPLCISYSRYFVREHKETLEEIEEDITQRLWKSEMFNKKKQGATQTLYYEIGEHNEDILDNVMRRTHRNCKRHQI
ncbi:MAG: hypothetical protein ABIB79_01810 [archaeon]